MDLPTLYQRIEGGALLFACLLLYPRTGHSWWIFAIVLVLVDVSCGGYLIDNRLGAQIYNFGHSAIAPLVLLTAGIAVDGKQVYIAVAIAWLAHVGMDRAAGFGLKFPDSFAHTHLGIIGKASKR